MFGHSTAVDVTSRPPASTVETHVGTLVQIHVGVAKETLGHAFHVPGYLIGQFGKGHFQVMCHLGTWLHLRDVKAIALTLPVCHTVEEDPVFFVWSVFDEGDVVAGLDAEHSKQLQSLAEERAAGWIDREALWQAQSRALVGPPLGVTVHLG